MKPSIAWLVLRAKTAALLLLCAARVGAQDAGGAAPLATIAVPVHDSDDAAMATVIVRGQHVPARTVNRTTGLDGAAQAQPLSLVTITREQIERLGARDLTQAIATEAATTTPASFQAQPKSGYNIRGFRATVLFDGFSNLSLYGDRDSMAGIERIDIVKGPGSALNSGALGLSPGGVVDIHSSWPGSRQSLDLGYGLGRYQQQQWQAEADSGALLPVLSLSLAADRAQGNGFFDFAELDRHKLRPALSLSALGGRASFYYESSARTMKDYPGLPTSGTLDKSRFSIPDSRSVNDPDVPLSQSRMHAWGVDLAWPLGRWLSLEAAARRSRTTLDQASQYITSNSPDTDPTGLIAPTTFNRMAATYAQDTSESQARARLSAHHDFAQLGRLQGWVGYNGEEAPDHVALQSGAATPVDLANPRYGSWSGAPIPYSEARSQFHIRNALAGLQWRYAQWLNAFAAVTRTHGEVRNRQTSVLPQAVGQLLGSQAQAGLEDLLFPILAMGPASGTGLFVLRNDDYRLLSRQFGVAVRLWDARSDTDDDGLWLFSGAGNGNQFQSYFTGAAQPRPELSQQREAGVRLVNSRFGRLESAVFRIQRRNVPTRDPNGVTGFEQITTGLQSVRGVDLEASLRLPYVGWDRISLDASAAWLKGRLDEDNTYTVGNTLPNVPAQKLRLQLSADLLRDDALLRVFVVGRCRSTVEGDLSNDFKVPGYCLADAGLSSRYRGFSADLLVNNLANTQTYEPYTYLFYGVIPGEARGFRLSLGYGFGAASRSAYRTPD